MSSDDEDDLMTILPSTMKFLSQYFLTSMAIVGNISCIFSLMMFVRKAMRKNPSGLYFLSFTLCNFIFINTMIPDAILYFGFHVDPTAKSLILCRIHFYIGFVTSALSSSYLILASIDRYIITSSNFHLRRFSTRSMARRLILGVTIFWIIFHIHPFFLMIEPEKTNKTLHCSVDSGVYVFVLIWYELIIFGFITPLLMILFGLRTVANVRSVLINPVSRLYAIDRQLIVIMLSQCFLCVLFRLPLPISLIYTYLAKTSAYGARYRMINTFLLYLTLMCFFAPYCTFFFVSLISRSFRVEFKRVAKHFVQRYILRNKRRLPKRRQRRVYPIQMHPRRTIIDRPAP